MDAGYKGLPAFASRWDKIGYAHLLSDGSLAFVAPGAPAPSAQSYFLPSQWLLIAKTLPHKLPAHKSVSKPVP